MSERNDHPSEDDAPGTDPNIALASGPPTEEIKLPPESVPPPPPPLRSPPPPPPPRASRPAPARSRPISSLPPRKRTPKPSDRAAKTRSRERSASPAPSLERQAPQRQRFMQMQTQLDEARSGLARQKNELDELRGELSAKEERIEAMLDELRASDSGAQVEARLTELDERGDAFAEELRRRLERTQERRAKVAAIDSRVKELEEGTEMSRVRMRLERVDHQLRSTLERVGAIESGQRDLAAKITAQETNDRRIARLESLFTELASELGDQRDGRDVDELRARLADVEALTVEAGSELKAQEGRLKRLSESIIPPPIQVGESGGGLTRVKGIGPKFARSLQANGVQTLAEIAGWAEVDVDRIAGQLGIKRARVAAWSASARALGDS